MEERVKTDPRFLILIMSVINYTDVQNKLKNTNPLVKPFGNVPAVNPNELSDAYRAMIESVMDLEDYYPEIAELFGDEEDIQEDENQPMLPLISLDK